MCLSDKITKYGQLDCPTDQIYYWWNIWINDTY